MNAVDVHIGCAIVVTPAFNEEKDQEFGAAFYPKGNCAVDNFGEESPFAVAPRSSICVVEPVPFDLLRYKVPELLPSQRRPALCIARFCGHAEMEWRLFRLEPKKLIQLGFPVLVLCHETRQARAYQLLVVDKQGRDQFSHQVGQFGCGVHFVGIVQALVPPVQWDGLPHRPERHSWKVVVRRDLLLGVDVATEQEARLVAAVVIHHHGATGVLDHLPHEPLKRRRIDALHIIDVLVQDGNIAAPGVVLNTERHIVGSAPRRGRHLKDKPTGQLRIQSSERRHCPARKVVVGTNGAANKANNNLCLSVRKALIGQHLAHARRGRPKVAQADEGRPHCGRCGLFEKLEARVGLYRPKGRGPVLGGAN
mmetsp:Transcript_1293/g.2470  ORF Transcript_1293/g.2470 Transcript_1293/m.2470 type:complete len:366 (-) Transcript_1293:669-1766(-)